MKVKLIAFGIAKDILKSRKLEIAVSGNNQIADLRKILLQQYPDFEKLKSLSFAVGDEYRNEDYSLSDGEEVAIIPPVSGG